LLEKPAQTVTERDDQRQGARLFPSRPIEPGISTELIEKSPCVVSVRVAARSYTRMVLLCWQRPRSVLEVLTMVRFRLALLSVAVLALAVSGGRFLAQDKGQSGKKVDFLERLVAKLKLEDTQKDALRKVETDYDAKADPIEDQIWALHHEEHEAMNKVLTPEQRARVPAFFKAVREQEMKRVAGELQLNDDQRMKIAQICEAFEPKFEQLAAERDQGERVHRQFRDLRRQLIQEIRGALDDQQREKLPLLVRQELRFWRNPELRRARFNEIGDKLGVSAEQKEQCKKVHEQYDPKIKELHTELKKVYQEEVAAIGKVLNDQQRTQLHEMMKHCVGADKDEAPK
jgi:hypothetical protein